jgi:hypothetical protein
MDIIERERRRGMDVLVDKRDQIGLRLRETSLLVG